MGSGVVLQPFLITQIPSWGEDPSCGVGKPGGGILVSDTTRDKRIILRGRVEQAEREKLFECDKEPGF